MPFTDPMADGPAIQAAGLRALQAGADHGEDAATWCAISAPATTTTPIVLMGYYNPIYIYGVERFLRRCAWRRASTASSSSTCRRRRTTSCACRRSRAGLNFIRLATPTTDDKRLPAVLANTSGFVYYVSITGITGAAAPDAGRVAQAVARIKRHTACRSRSASASGTRRAPPRSRAAPTPWWSARRSSSGCAPASTPPARRRPARLPAGDGLVGRARGGRAQRAPAGGGVAAVNWITNVVRPKIRSFLNRRDVPENLWIKCPDTGQMVFYRDLEANRFVIPGSNYHMRMGAAARLKSMFDGEHLARHRVPEVSHDPLKFRDEQRYTDRLKDARAKTGLNDAVKLGARQARRPAGGDRGAGLRLHGRLAGHGGRRGVRPRARDRGRRSARPSSCSPPRAARACRKASCR